MIRTCPRCFSADDVGYQRLPDKMVMYTCARAHDGAGPHTWTQPVRAVAWDEEASVGVTDELMEPLLSCVIPGEPFAEYGVIEHRFRVAFPELFAAHVAARGHTMLAPKIATASSVRFGVALGRLARSGELLSLYGPATGAWSYNGQLTYWARPPAPAGTHLTWVAYCRRLDRSPDWTDDDRAAASGSRP